MLPAFLHILNFNLGPFSAFKACGVKYVSAQLVTQCADPRADKSPSYRITEKERGERTDNGNTDKCNLCNIFGVTCTFKTAGGDNLINLEEKYNYQNTDYYCAKVYNSHIVGEQVVYLPAEEYKKCAKCNGEYASKALAGYAVDFGKVTALCTKVHTYKGNCCNRETVAKGKGHMHTVHCNLMCGIGCCAKVCHNHCKHKEAKTEAQLFAECTAGELCKALNGGFVKGFAFLHKADIEISVPVADGSNGYCTGSRTAQHRCNGSTFYA